jgi:UDPglucose--hexose-1-phosphate uridylyltransferase
LIISPRNNRIGGEANPDYKGTYVFGNDFPAVKQVQPEFDPKALKTNSLVQDKVDRLFHVEGVRGVAKVICFSPNHNLTMAAMTEQEIGCIIQEWINQTKELRNVSFVNYVQFFENKGATMGCSNRI